MKATKPKRSCAVLEREINELRGTLAEEQEQKAAVSEILDVMSRTRHNVMPVLRVIARHALRLCQTGDARIWLVEGDRMTYFTGAGRMPASKVGFAVAIDRRSVPGRAIVDRKPVHVRDFADEPASKYPVSREIQSKHGAILRTMLAVPLVRKDQALGVILLRKSVVQPFTKSQISLVRTFAHQAAIAIENVRLFNETKEALEQQTVISDILRVISSSPTDTQPVFDAIVNIGVHLFHGMNISLRLIKGDRTELVASTLPIREFSIPLRDEQYTSSRAILRREVVQVPDIFALEGIPERQKQRARDRGFRAHLSAPMLRDNDAIGAINVLRAAPGPFSEREVALLKTFADQAVIAIENVRLFNETKEALEQQTASAEILKVISSSPTDVQPVFDTIAESAARLCESLDSVIFRREGDRLVLMAHCGSIPLGPIGEYTLPLDRRTVPGRSISDGRMVHVADLQAEAGEFPEGSEVARRTGFRTALAVPLMREGVAIGAIGVRRAEAQPFSDRQVELLKTFADQAVIAIENVRLFKELEAKNSDLAETLEQQTATAEILRVISSSPTDVQPVFDAIAGSAARLCNASDVVIRRVDGQVLRLAAHMGAIPVAANTLAVTSGTVPGAAVIGRRTIHVHDVQDAHARGEYPEGAELQRVAADRTFLAVPLLRDDAALGVIVIRRREVQPFSNKQIKLLETFADQAVIAIENVRLFNETKEALEQQTVISEILRVISSSPTDTQPVFEAIVKSGVQLFNGMNISLRLVRGDHTEAAASTLSLDEHDGPISYPLTDDRNISSRAILERDVVQVPDVFAADWVDHRVKERATRRGHRAIMAAPMMREDHAIGSMVVTRATAGPFPDKQVVLLKTFADQAVIAIENVRLFKELEARNAELTESLDRQTATADILRVISSSPTDIQPVLDAVAQSAARLCGADDVVIRLVEGSTTRIAAHVGSIPVPPDGGVRSLNLRTLMGAVVRTGMTIHIPDITESSIRKEYSDSIFAGAGKWGVRTNLLVPLLREGVAIGAIAIRRQEVRPFSAKQIELLETFAAQAVIAIENVRLFKELQGRNAEITETLEQQTVTSEILRVISSSPTDTQPVFDAIVNSGARLFGDASVSLRLIKGNETEMVASTSAHGVGEQICYLVNDEAIPSSRAIRRRQVVEVPDIPAEDWIDKKVQGRAEKRGVRATVAAPMLKENTAIGAILVGRTNPGPFTDKEVALLRTFADQAVIAIENVRLFTELQEKNHAISEALEQQTATAEVLRVISSSPTDLQPVFDAILENATRLCDAHMGTLGLYDGTRYRHVAQRGANPHYAQHIFRGAFDPATTPIIGRVVRERHPVHVPDLRETEAYLARNTAAIATAEAGGGRSILAVPMLKEERVVGCIFIYRPEVRPFTEKQIALLSTFANQAVIAIENVRLFKEIQEKSRQLEIANKHKSDFLANVSHELRTPLNCINGFSDMLLARMFGEINPKQEEFLRDIHSSGEHLLSLINDILDLSKIEAGRMELNLAVIDPALTLENMLVLVQERAARKNIALKLEVEQRLEKWVADERKFKQIMLNLLSNALKFTSEGGQILVTAARQDADLVVSVSDTGVGIRPEDQEIIFEEFRQAGSDYTKKAEGTGLGLALTRKFVELHGGTIRVESAEGKGATFTFTLPEKEEVAA